MITVLQRDLGVRYNPAKRDESTPLETADTFVHGIIQGEGGTCGSLPVVYVAVGRRLGYPLKLASAQTEKWGHLYVRWDDPKGETFNIEGSGQGMNSDPDDFYRTGIFSVSPELEREWCLLKSKTPRQELASFLVTRASRWQKIGNRRGQVEAVAWALALHPENRLYWDFVVRSMNTWHQELTERIPPGFPPIHLAPDSARRFPPEITDKMEKDNLYLEVVENLLNDPNLNRKMWEPMRQGRPLPTRPVQATVRRRSDGCDIGIRYSTTPEPLVW